MNKEDKIFVLTYKYSDNSGFGIIKGYSTINKKLADRNLTMLRTHSDKEFKIEEINFII